MGTVITFPESRRYQDCRTGVLLTEPATIIILPVIRLERFDDPGDRLSDGPRSPGRKRRPRTSRP
jgi:hypothetical protein